MNYKFVYDNKEYMLCENNCEGIFFDDENEITGLSLNIILEALNKSDDINFSNEYYAGKCSCEKQEQINKYYRYLEYHFYIYTKNNEYIINTICQEYENTSFNKLFSLGKVDDSYIVNVTVCPDCGFYSVEVSQCTV